MRSFLGRYVIAIVDQKSGVERRATVSVGPVLAVAAVIIALPLVISFCAAWQTKGVVQGLYASHLALELEAANYRVAIEALTRQVASQQTTMAALPANSAGSSAWARLNPVDATPMLQSRPAMPTLSQGSSVPAALVGSGAAVGGKYGANGRSTGGLPTGARQIWPPPDIGRRRSRRAGAAVEADARFRAAEQPLLPEVRKVAAVSAAAPFAESQQRARTPAPIPADVEDAIREVIAQYVIGLESQSVPALKRVWPSLGGREERAIQRELENARIVETGFKDPRITINGDTTTVTGFRMHSLVTQDGQRLSSVTKTTMTLRRNGNAWTIEHIVNEQ